MERDRDLDTEAIKVVLRHRLKLPLDAWYGDWRSSEVAERSRESLFDDVARDVLSVLHLHPAHSVDSREGVGE